MSVVLCGSTALSISRVKKLLQFMLKIFQSFSNINLFLHVTVIIASLLLFTGLIKESYNLRWLRPPIKARRISSLS